jgi:hypothetical protein
MEVVAGAAEALEGSPRRRFMAGIVRLLGEGGQRLVESMLGWNRGTVRKGEDCVFRGIVNARFAAS